MQAVTYEWATQAGGTGSDEGMSVSVLADGSSIVTGLSFKVPPPSAAPRRSQVLVVNDVFVAKLDASGDLRMG